MKLRQLACLLLVASCAHGAAGAADLAKIDRSIRREPAYRSAPRYCLLVFGPEAEHRVWLVLDGDSLYVDRNGNGDLTKDGTRVAVGKWEPAKAHPAHSHEKFIRAGDLQLGGLTHTGLTVVQTQFQRKIDPSVENAKSWQTHNDDVWRQTGDGITFLVYLDLDTRCYEQFKTARDRNVRHCSAAWWIGSPLSFGRSRADAPVLHFGGPLTLRVADTELRRGKKPQEVTANLGTPGLGAFVVADYELVPDDLSFDPVLEVEFPSGAPGLPPLTQKIRLDHRC